MKRSGESPYRKNDPSSFSGNTQASHVQQIVTPGVIQKVGSFQKGGMAQPQHKKYRGNRQFNSGMVLPVPIKVKPTSADKFSNATAVRNVSNKNTTHPEESAGYRSEKSATEQIDVPSPSKPMFNRKPSGDVRVLDKMNTAGSGVSIEALKIQQEDAERQAYEREQQLKREDAEALRQMEVASVSKGSRVSYGSARVVVNTPLPSYSYVVKKGEKTSTESTNYVSSSSRHFVMPAPFSGSSAKVSSMENGPIFNGSLAESGTSVRVGQSSRSDQPKSNLPFQATQPDRNDQPSQRTQHGEGSYSKQNRPTQNDSSSQNSRSQKGSSPEKDSDSSSRLPADSTSATSVPQPSLTFTTSELNLINKDLTKWSKVAKEDCHEVGEYEYSVGVDIDHVKEILEHRKAVANAMQTQMQVPSILPSFSVNSLPEMPNQATASPSSVCWGPWISPQAIPPMIYAPFYYSQQPYGWTGQMAPSIYTYQVMNQDSVMYK